jgi:alpha-beta hydrolase superfamily lysophospholipase
MKTLAVVALVCVIALAVIAGAAMAFGGPGNPPPMSSISNPFKNVDYSDLPPPSRFVARDGATLTYRVYPSAAGGPQGSVVLVHGSSARSNSMHVMAKAFAAAGYSAYALDIRGHGESGVRGHIAYVGQLEDDLEDFERSVKPASPATLAGFSSGGGFVLRVAGSDRQKLFSSYLLLSPFISQDAPTYRPDSGGWVSVGLPRYVAVALLNAVGVRVFNDLAVTRFALNEEAKAFLTPQYSFALAQNFRPKLNYRANIRAANQLMRLVAGRDDEVFYADRFAEVFKAESKDIPVTLVPGIAHIPLTLEPTAVQAAVAAVRAMH